jgi:protein-disulfide isomerase
LRKRIIKRFLKGYFISISMEDSEKKNVKEEEESSEEKASYTEKFRENPWMLATLVLGTVLLVFILYSFSGRLTGAVISSNTAGENFVNFINSQSLGNISLVNSTDFGSGLYEITVSSQGQDVPVYLTKDGKYFIQGVIPLTTESSQGTNTAQNPSQPVDIPIGNSPVLGNSNAKLTIVEFSDFSCPYCGAASGQAADMVSYMKTNDPTWLPAVPGIIKDYVNTGKAKLVYKYSMGHTGGHPATLVGLCLNDQGLFWKFHDKAFADQADVENLDKMKSLAQSVGADMTKLNACLTSKKYDSKLNDDEALGQSVGIGGTPAIYANGIKVANGAQSYTDVKKAIDAVLANTATA